VSGVILVRDLRYVLDSYAPITKSQRGCPDGCGCTDCEMVEDLYALIRVRGET
jgi:hypothetical protein